jgi:hypothetical protein
LSTASQIVSHEELITAFWSELQLQSFNKCRLHSCTTLLLVRTRTAAPLARENSGRERQGLPLTSVGS